MVNGILVLFNQLLYTGLETVTMDVEKSLVTVKSGAVNLTELRSYFKDELKKDVEIIDPVEVKIPACKKEEDAGIAIKKERDDEATKKKIESSTAAFDMKYRGVGEEDKGKDDGITGEKEKGSSRGRKAKVFVVDVASKERGRGDESGSSKKGEDCDGTRNANAEIYYRRNNSVKIFHCDFLPVKGVDVPYEMFNDENPHSCFIL